MGKFIFDPLTGDPTILATTRANRPDQTGSVTSIAPDKENKKKKPKEKKEKVDPFAKGNEHMTPEASYQDQEDWNVRVFSNKYPLLEDHEVIVHSPDPKLDIEDMDCEQIKRIIRAYLNRVSHFNSQGKEVIVFNNRGGKAGASLTHPHSQIVAAKGFPGEVARQREAALKYYNQNESDYWSDDIKNVIQEGTRLVHESEHFVLYIPKACRWSYEMRMVPKDQKPNFGFINEEEIEDLAPMLKGALIAYDKMFDRPDRNFWIFTSRYDPYCWHIGFLPQIKVFGALELGAGIWVSDKASPEEAAHQLRKTFEYHCDCGWVGKDKPKDVDC